MGEGYLLDTMIQIGVSSGILLHSRVAVQSNSEACFSKKENQKKGLSMFSLEEVIKVWEVVYLYLIETLLGNT